MMAKKTHCIRKNHDPAGIRHWQSRSAQNVCLHPCQALALRFSPFAPRPSFKVWRRIKLLLHYTITILTSMASDRVVSINSRNTVRSIPMAVFPNVSTSWWINVLSGSGFFCCDFQLSPIVCAGCALWECATAHSCSSESQLTTRLERVCKRAEL